METTRRSLPQICIQFNLLNPMSRCLNPSSKTSKTALTMDSAPMIASTHQAPPSVHHLWQLCWSRKQIRVLHPQGWRKISPPREYRSTLIVRKGRITHLVKSSCRKPSRRTHRRAWHPPLNLLACVTERMEAAQRISSPIQSRILPRNKLEGDWTQKLHHLPKKINSKICNQYLWKNINKTLKWMQIVLLLPTLREWELWKRQQRERKVWHMNNYIHKLCYRVHANHVINHWTRKNKTKQSPHACQEAHLESINQAGSQRKVRIHGRQVWEKVWLKMQVKTFLILRNISQAFMQIKLIKTVGGNRRISSDSSLSLKIKHCFQLIKCNLI